MLYRLNSPHVVHETMDGDTILLNLKTGIYYSFDGLGAVVWQSIMHTGSENHLLNNLVGLQQNEAGIRAFVQTLLEEELLVESDSSVETTAKSELDLQELYNSVGDIQDTLPELKKYSDMMEILLLDPIHEVDETEGWPEAKS